MTASVTGRDWRSGRACGTADPELFFPSRYDDAGEAKALCRTCPVREPCLRSLETEAPVWGIWGGFGGRARRVITREYQAGRPLADIIAADDEQFYAAAERQPTASERENARKRDKRRLAREQREAEAVAA